MSSNEAIKLLAEANKMIAACDYKNAVAVCTAALETYPPKAHTIYAVRSQANHALKHFGAALEDADSTVLRAEDYAKGHLRRGAALRSMGQTEAAWHALKRAYELDPTDTQSRLLLQTTRTDLLLHQQQTGEALAFDVEIPTVAARPKNAASDASPSPRRKLFSQFSRENTPAREKSNEAKASPPPKVERKTTPPPPPAATPPAPKDTKESGSERGNSPLPPLDIASAQATQDAAVASHAMKSPDPQTRAANAQKSNSSPETSPVAKKVDTTHAHSPGVRKDPLPLFDTEATTSVPRRRKRQGDGATTPPSNSTQAFLLGLLALAAVVAAVTGQRVEAACIGLMFPRVMLGSQRLVAVGGLVAAIFLSIMNPALVLGGLAFYCNASNMTPGDSLGLFTVLGHAFATAAVAPGSIAAVVLGVSSLGSVWLHYHCTGKNRADALFGIPSEVIAATAASVALLRML